MTPEQVRLVRSSWPTIEANADALTTRFYVHLFDSDASTARLFSHVDMAAQRNKLAQSLAVVVKALDDPDRLMPALAALGKRHTGYGVEHGHFATVGSALLLALADTLGEAFTPVLRTAWADAYAIVAAVMQRALERSQVTA